MRTVVRPESEPQQLSDLRQQGGENFGILNPVLDQVFGEYAFIVNGNLYGGRRETG